MEWSEQRKEHIKLILSKGIEYVSSEESGDDDDKHSTDILLHG